MVKKITHHNRQNEQILTEDINFRGHLSTFRADNAPKGRPFMAISNAKIFPEKLVKNFEKVKKTYFSTPKMTKTLVSTRQKVSTFKTTFALRALRWRGSEVKF